MLNLIRQRVQKKRSAEQLYGSIVAQARREDFYRLWRIPDTIDGRFDMIVVHLFLVLCRMKQEGDDGEQAGRLLIEAFFSDMDDSVRELGAGDLGVPKHVRKMAGAFYGRLSAYEKAEEGGEIGALAHVVRRNFFPDEQGDENGPEAQAATAVARYMQESREVLQQISFEQLTAGRVTFSRLISDAKGSEQGRS